MLRSIFCLLLSVCFSFDSTVFAQRLVLPGDYPDPSVVKIGDTYWASATTSNWAPVYPLLQSKDLVNWTLSGHVFDQKPEWADYYFWAPEISYENGKVYIYYSAHKKGGNLCLGIASADRPEGPYKDHGPLMCQPAGSIDAFPMRDEKGDLYLIWKEDGNSVRQPTPIWASRINEERTALVGEKVELFRNTEPWEANLVEGVSMVKHGDYFYAFYAAAGCCGPGCTYANGVARSKSLLGPWEKYQKNPLLANTAKWKCPGHGTPVEKNGRNYFLYHAYENQSTVFAGRQGMLMEYRVTNDGWIEFVEDPAGTADVQPPTFKTDFNADTLEMNWQWSIFRKPDFNIAGGSLILKADTSTAPSYIAQKTYSSAYTVSAAIDRRASTARTGIAFIGDERNIVSLLLDNNRLSIVERKNGKDSVLASEAVSGNGAVYVRAIVKDARKVVFQCSTNNRKFTDINEMPVDVGFLPPWDRAVRAGIIALGVPGQVGSFSSFSITQQ